MKQDEKCFYFFRLSFIFFSLTFTSNCFFSSYFFFSFKPYRSSWIWRKNGIVLMPFWILTSINQVVPTFKVLALRILHLFVLCYPTAAVDVCCYFCLCTILYFYFHLLLCITAVAVIANGNVCAVLYAVFIIVHRKHILNINVNGEYLLSC